LPCSNRYYRMKRNIVILLIVFLFAFSCSTTRINKERKIEERPSVRCMENSPERRGEEGCTILTNRRLAGSLPKNVYWHIDLFDSIGAAMKMAGPNGVAVEAHGSFWLLTVEDKTENHHGGHHIAWIGPLVLPATDGFSMRVQSSLLNPGSTTPVHTHSGPEVFFIVDGEQCIEMLDGSQHLGAGQSYVVPARTVHRGRVIGSVPRRALALIVYEAAYPASSDIDKSPSLSSCK
jgi:quercetin dioxygenase-like cupin family protein